MTKTLTDVLAELDAYEEAHPWRTRFHRARRRVRDFPGNSRRRVTFARQRVTRGWDDSAVWSLDVWLCRTLGAQLTHMAGIAHGWPAGGEWTFDMWVNTLRENGDALTAYGETNELDVSAVEADALLAAAQDALRWVADNLPALWD